jgi:hypothetical protein
MAARLQALGCRLSECNFCEVPPWINQEFKCKAGKRKPEAQSLEPRACFHLPSSTKMSLLPLTGAPSTATSSFVS